MKGYKIAFHEERIGGRDVINGLHYETTINKIPVLIVLDIPDDAQTSTPENRYTEEKMTKMRTEWSRWSRQLTPPYVDAALKESAAYHTYKDEDPITIYNELIKEYDGALSRFVHASKCRCDGAKVVDIIGIFNGTHYTHAVSMFDPYFIYELGKTVSCEDFNTYSRMAVCAPGIHYFEYPVFAILYMLEGMDFLVAPVRDGKIDSEVADRYFTEELNTLKREDKAIEYCEADVALTEKLFEASCRNSAYGLSARAQYCNADEAATFGKDEDNEE